MVRREGTAAGPPGKPDEEGVPWFKQLDKHVVRRLNMFRQRRYGRHAKPGQRICWKREDYEAQGLHRLRGTVRYPKPCMLHRESPPVSRVREIRMHGLKGGGGIRTA